MKPIIQKLWMFIAVLCASLSASAYDFKSDGLYYNILSEEDRTVEVTYYSNNYDDNKNYVKGDIEIPRKLIHNSKTYTVTSIGYAAFRYCSSLTSVTIPNSVTSIGDDAFFGCSSLTSVTIPNSVTSIGESAFSNCSSLENINVDPENNNYSSIDGIVYNKNATNLISCPGAKISVTIPNSVTSIGNYAFYGCSNLTSVTIPNTVTSIGNYAFRECSSLTSVTIPNSVTSIGLEAFAYCSSLASVTIPNSVTSIGNYAFYGCSNLTSVTIPNSVTSIGYDAFYGCDNLKSIYMQCEVPIECNPGFGEKVLKENILYVPTGTIAKYEKVDPWRNFWNIEEMDFSGVEEIEADEYGAPHISVNNGVLTIDGIDSHESVTIYDMQGRIVYNGISHTIDKLSPGLYIVKAGSRTIKVSI